MAYTLDPEIAAVFAKMAEQGVSMPVTPRGDWKALRAAVTEAIPHLLRPTPPTPDVAVKVFSATTKDGSEIELRWSAKKDGRKGPAVLHVHGGGMIFGSAQM